MIQTELITDPTEIRELQAAWQRTKASGSSNIFTSPEWCHAAWRILPDLGLPRLLIARDHGSHAHAVLPLSATSGGLVCAASPMGDEHDLRLHPQTAPVETARSVVVELEHRAQIDENLRLHDLRPDGTLVGATSTAVGCAAPVLPLIDATTSLNAPPGGSPQRRRGLTRRRGALNALGTVAVDRVTIPERLRDEVPRFVADRLNQWRQRGRLHELPAADRHPRFGEFLATAAAALASRGQCFLNRLLLDGRPLARGLYFRTGRTDLLYMSTYVLDYAKYSPSHLLLLDSAEIAMREGITTIELGRGDEQYKFDLGAESRYLRDVIR